MLCWGRTNLISMTQYRNKSCNESYKGHEDVFRALYQCLRATSSRRHNLRCNESHFRSPHAILQTNLETSRGKYKRHQGITDVFFLPIFIEFPYFSHSHDFYRMSTLRPIVLNEIIPNSGHYIRER